MNGEPSRGGAVCASIAGIVGTFLVAFGLVWAMRHYTQPPPLGAQRAAERAAALAELRAAETDALEHPGWIGDASKGIVRLPIDVALRMVQHDWGQNPLAARSNLVARVEKATAPPPKVPEKPSQFE